MNETTHSKKSRATVVLGLVAAIVVAGLWIANDTSRAQTNFAALADVSGQMPVGTIVAYMGYQAPPGWLLCDGAKIPMKADYLALIDFLQTTKTPDLRGCFLRGLDSSQTVREDEQTPPKRDPDWQTRFLGGVQLNSTGLPNNPFVIGGGQHTHKLNRSVLIINGDESIRCNEGGYRGQFLNGVSTTDDGGAHSHSMSGGDAETRPLNVAVNYIIKY